MLAQGKTADWYQESRGKIAAGEPLIMKWNWGCKTKKLSDLVPSTSPGIVLSDRAFEKLNHLLRDATPYSVLLADGTTFHGAKAGNCADCNIKAGHLIVIYPKHNYTMISETFKRVWEANGFTGAVFELVDEIDDAAFVTP